MVRRPAEDPSMAIGFVVGEPERAVERSPSPYWLHFLDDSHSVGGRFEREMRTALESTYAVQNSEWARCSVIERDVR